jgi:hypothetical protein
MWTTRREIIIKIYTHKILGPRQQYRPPYRKKDQALFSGWIWEKSTIVNTHTVCMSWVRVWLAADLGFKLLFLKYISTDKLRNRMPKTLCVKKNCQSKLKKTLPQDFFQNFLVFSLVKPEDRHCPFSYILWHPISLEFRVWLCDLGYIIYTLRRAGHVTTFLVTFHMQKSFLRILFQATFLVLGSRKGCWKSYIPVFFKDSWTPWISTRYWQHGHQTKA